MLPTPIRYQVQKFLVVFIPLMFVVLVVVFAVSACDVRKRSEKSACTRGDAGACLALGVYYEDKADGPIGFAMSNGVTAATYFDLGCTHGSIASCARLGRITFHGPEAAKLYATGYERGVDALAQACVGKDEPSCKELEAAYDNRHGGTMAEARAARWFLDACLKRDDAEGCYRFAIFISSAHKEAKAEPELAVTYFARACKSGHGAACTRAK